MQIIVFIIIISLTVATGFLCAFFWAVKDGQYEDSYTHSIRLLIDDDMIPIEGPEENQSKEIQSRNKIENDTIRNV